MSRLVESFPALVPALAALAETEPEREVCGLVLESPGGAMTLAPARNVAQEPTRRFEVDPRALLDVQRRARSGGPALAAVYHSHPSGGAALSAADRASLLLDDGAPVLPGVDLLVVGLGEGRAEEVRLHRWSAPGAFSEVARAVLSRTSGEGARWVISAKLP